MKGLRSPGGATEAFEEALSDPTRERYILRLFVTGITPKSLRAIENIRAICEEELSNGDCDLEVVDIYQHPEKLQREQIVVAPTLVKKAPLPVRRMIGDLSNKDRVLAGLDLVRHRAAS